MVWWNWAIPLASAFLGYQGAKKQADAVNKGNQQQQEKYESDLALRQPGVDWASGALSGTVWVDAEGNRVAPGTAGAKEISQFQPFIDKAGQLSSSGFDVANQYLANVPQYQQAGLRGLAAYNQLADITPEQQEELADYYTGKYGAGAQSLAEKEADEVARRSASSLARNQGRFGALSSQKGRADAYVDQARTDAYARAGERAKQEGYNRAQSELNRRYGLAGSLTTLGTSGLAQAQQASQLGQGAFQSAVGAPFAPALQYGQAIGAQPNVTLPQYGTAPDPFATGVGLGLQTWNRFGQ